MRSAAYSNIIAALAEDGLLEPHICPFPDLELDFDIRLLEDRTFEELTQFEKDELEALAQALFDSLSTTPIPTWNGKEFV